MLKWSSAILAIIIFSQLLHQCQSESKVLEIKRNNFTRCALEFAMCLSWQGCLYWNQVCTGTGNSDEDRTKLSSQSSYYPKKYTKIFKQIGVSGSMM